MNSEYNEETKFRIDFLASEAVDIFADVLAKKVLIEKNMANLRCR